MRDKPASFLKASASATVPALRVQDRVLDESLDIMVWALEQNDPQNWLDMPEDGWRLIEDNDGPFKSALDHTKYAVRYPDLDPKVERANAAGHLIGLDGRISDKGWIFDGRPTLADYAILPFVRQFANTDRAWFDAQDWPSLRAWLDRFTDSSEFRGIMQKYTPWSPEDAPVWFGD